MQSTLSSVSYFDLRCSQNPSVKNYNLTSVRMIMSGAAPLSDEINNRLFDLFPNAQIGQSYGQDWSYLLALTQTLYRYDGDMYSPFVLADKSKAGYLGK